MQNYFTWIFFSKVNIYKFCRYWIGKLFLIKKIENNFYDLEDPKIGGPNGPGSVKPCKLVKIQMKKFFSEIENKL